jgi:hypothetical protein
VNNLDSQGEKDIAYHKYMEERAGVERPQPLSPASELLTYRSWSRVPSTLKSRTQWLRQGRKVRANEKPVARVVYPRFLEEGESIGDQHVLDWSDGLVMVTSTPTNIFRESQTTPYTPTPRTTAYWTFEDIFLRNASRTDYIYRAVNSDGEESEWITCQTRGAFGRTHSAYRLTASQVHAHLNHGKIIGLKNETGTTRFVAIDLDYHGRDREVFLEQAAILLNQFHGDTWHYQARQESVSGLHFFRVFPSPTDCSSAHDEIRQILQRLDDEHPDLRDRAKAAGMKSLADIEVYPAKGQGMRLPLAHGRCMILDSYVSTITHNNRRVGDVERYVAWLMDPDRKHKPVEHILEYLNTFTFEEEADETAGCTPVRIDRTRTIAPSATQGWRRCQRQRFMDFWIHGEANQIPLNEHIAVLARTAWAYGHSQAEATTRIKKMVRDLPEAAQTCSSRLLKQQWGKIDNAITTTVKYSYAQNSRQEDVAGSTTKLELVAAHYRTIGFDPLNPATWARTTTQERQIAFSWTETQQRRLIAFLRSPLKAPSDAEIMPFVEGVIRLAVRMSGRQWGHSYFYTWAKAEHTSIKLGFTEKRLRVLKTLTDEGFCIGSSAGLNVLDAVSGVLVHWQRRLFRLTTLRNPSPTLAPRRTSEKDYRSRASKPALSRQSS